MATFDLNGIATNLAASYANLTPPTGEPAIRQATADPPEVVPVTPFVLVTVAQGEDATFSYGAQFRSGTVPLHVDFLLDKASDLARTERRLRAWLPVLLDATLTGIHLGLPDLVATSWTDRFSFGDTEYAGQSWAAIRLVVIVRTTDGITPTA